MQISGEPKAFIRSEAQAYVDLYASLGERAEIFLPKEIFDNLRSFVRLCYEEPDDPAKQQAEINAYLLKFREDIPGYIDVALILMPHDESKAFQYSTQRNKFRKRLTNFIDTESVCETDKKKTQNIIDGQDLSIGTPPVSAHHINFMSQIQLGDLVADLRKYRDIIGITDNVDEAHWNYLMDTLQQMISQSSHYTTAAEKADFLHRSEWAVNFKGLNGMIRTVVSGSANSVVKLLKGDVFAKESVQVVEGVSTEEEAEKLFEQMEDDATSVFAVKVAHARKNLFASRKWFPNLSRLVIIDDSVESRSSNTCLVFGFHNGIISTLNKVHNKKMGAPANSQLNIRLILENVGEKQIKHFRQQIEWKISVYQQELDNMQMEQLGEKGNVEKNIALYKLDDFSRQIIKDKYALEKLRDFMFFLENAKKPEDRAAQSKELLDEFEARVQNYFYSGAEDLQIATVIEGGGRNQIRTYGEYLLAKNKNGKSISEDIKKRCQVILDLIPSNYQRTLRNHFHKNFGVNLFMEKYQQHLAKVDNGSDNKGRYRNFLIDLGIYEDYITKTDEEKKIIGEFLAGLGTSDKTSVSDGVQQIIRDLLFNKEVKPYIIYNQQLAWEYTDLFPDERFDLNPFDIEIENEEDGRVAYDRLVAELQRIKTTLALFDETGSLWDTFCENTSIIVNDPDNPSGYSDFNSEPLKNFLSFLNSTKVTLFLDEAYQDAVKIEDDEMPKWRTISRYVVNNISSLSKIRAVSSLSTTKNLGATGNRLGSLIGTFSAADVFEYARKQNDPEMSNNNSMLMLNNIIAFGQIAKKIKDVIEVEMPKNASRSKVKKVIVNFIKNQIISTAEENKKSQKKLFNKITGFEGSPIHLFLLEELRSLDKLDVLGLADDFKYGDMPFYKYYSEHLLKELNKFRVNKNFRRESLKRLKTAKKIGQQIIAESDYTNASVVDSDGSYLFNIQLHNFSSYADLQVFCKKLALQRGVAVLPYKTGMVRFSLGGYLSGSEQSYKIFEKELTDGLNIFLSYWFNFQQLRAAKENKEIESQVLIDQLFAVSSEKEFLQNVMADFPLSRDCKKDKAPGIFINDIRTVYHASPQISGVSINGVGDSDNAVFEFQGAIGQCRNVEEFLRSQAFTKIYEHLLAQIHTKIPQLKNLSFNTVASKYSKAVILKYITNKKTFEPNRNVVDNPEELFTMREILIEMENLLFDASKFKILSLDASEAKLDGLEGKAKAVAIEDNAAKDITRLEGVNSILRKFIHEIMLHFDLPFNQEAIEPSRKEILAVTLKKFEDVTGINVSDINLQAYFDAFMNKLRKRDDFKETYLGKSTIGYIIDALTSKILDGSLELSDKLLYFYLLKNDDSFAKLVVRRLNIMSDKIETAEEGEVRMLTEATLTSLLDEDLEDILSFIIRKKDIKVSQEELHGVTRKVVLYFINLMNATKGTQKYDKYTHTLIKIVETQFRKQNSSLNEMIQHGLTIFRNFDVDNGLQTFDGGRLSWINELMAKCGVVGSEQPVQVHTNIVTDAKKREYPFHRVDRNPETDRNAFLEEGKAYPLDYVKRLFSKPDSKFFERRLAEFVGNMDEDDYRCKIVTRGLVTEMFVFQKSYIKYMTDNFRLNFYEDVTLDEAKSFVPDILLFLGAPEKVMSFPQVGYFDIDGPNGKIKTVVTPLKKEADYLGDVKKPRLSMMNEKVKEMGGVPKHGSLFAVEEEDGSVFVIEIDGDSGVGKSEMLAALILQWLRDDLQGIRSVKMIAGDMFHVFQDKKGSIYGIGTEVGDFSRLTDFDPDFIRYYRYLFETSADSNITDLNSRSTVSGLCDITMPFKIDIMLTAHNYAKGEAGITRIDNPENFLSYIDSHGERKEKATSQDGPHFQRTLKRYTADERIVDLMAQHGNYLDDVLDWVLADDNVYYLCSSYKMVDKIDIEKVVSDMFLGKPYSKNAINYQVTKTRFDLIANRFWATASSENEEDVEFVITRNYFSSLFDSLASTPGGQPFIAEEGQEDNIMHMTNVLKGGPDGDLAGKKVQCGILSTEIGKKGKEITGPQKAAQDMKRLIQEVRILNPEINQKKNSVKKLIKTKYKEVYGYIRNSSEVWRYNFYLYQLHVMRQADFRRIDDINVKVDLSNSPGFEPIPESQDFNPLLVTPNLNIELSAFGETYNELVELPNYEEMVAEFKAECDSLFVAEGYCLETKVNNMIVQLLLKGDYIDADDIARGKVAEKVNRETIAAAKKAVIDFLKGKAPEEKQLSPKAPVGTPPATAPKKTTSKVKKSNQKPKNN